MDESCLFLMLQLRTNSFYFIGNFLCSANPHDYSKRFTLYCWQTCSIEHHLDLSGKYPSKLQLMCEDCSYTNIHHIETCPRFDAPVKDMNPGSLSRESQALATAPLCHCTTVPLCHCATAYKTPEVNLLNVSRNI